MATKKIETLTGLGLLIHREGIRRGMTMAEQAAALGLHRNALQRWGVGTRTPLDDNWAMLAAWFGVDPLWLYARHKDGSLRAEVEKMIEQGI